ncbi:Fur family transcriptional regulator [Mahella sp.]|uniref:Fur family transcriptional regulator n=1 Tax=Mahella sp. TaxID=2798721 RepID=UPI0025C0DA20|nr:Fur family transcriptional regulator [Mahella sp.]MBZ4666306.1 ferric uptake regulator, Fur family [Mahella sp.]MDK2902887.1 Fur family transcriptional regulator, ferric uptake regulator [Clostridiales bacterium]
MDNTNTTMLKQQLQQKGYKFTTQRRATLDAIVENEGKHMTPEEIYEQVKKKYPEIGLATIYRTLQLLEEMDVIYRVDFDDGKTRYELNHHNEDHQHHHLICIKCGKVIEVKEDFLERLEKLIEVDYDFYITDHRLKFFGYCSECRNAQNEDE